MIYKKLRIFVQATSVLLLFLSFTAVPQVAAGHGDTGGHVVGDGVVDTPLEMDKLHHEDPVTDGEDTGQQHGGLDGHLPGSSENVELVGQLTVSGIVPGRISDVGTLGNYAYLGAFNTPCGEGGVYIVDISDPTSPTEVGFIPTGLGSFVGEGVQAIHIDTNSFEGDILVINNEICGISGSQIGGFSIYDVTNPLAPVALVEGAGDTSPGGSFSTANQIHSAFAWQQGKKAYVVIVDDEELEDVDIFDITNPGAPVQIAEVGLANWPGAQDAQSDGIGGFAASFIHDVVVKKVSGKWLMLVSYWDAGYIVLNVNNPAAPVFVNDTTFTDPDPLTGTSPPEGNAHQAEWNHNSKFILAADEDFSPFQAGEFQITTGSFAEVYPSVVVPGAAASGILPDQTLNGPTVYGGYGCPDSAPIPSPASIPGYLSSLQPGEEKIVVLQRGPTGDPSAPEPACFPGDKAHQAVLAGWDAVLFVNRHVFSTPPEPVPPFCGSGAFVDTIVGICTTHEAYHKLFDTPVSFTYPDGPALGTVGAKIQADSIFDGWGYMHLFDAKTLKEIDTYAIAEALDPAFASGFGDLSVHEVAVDPNKNLAYVSYYAGGFRVIEFGKNGIEEVGHFIDVNGNNFWGVQIAQLDNDDERDEGDDDHGTLILASDRDSGLWIFKYTGP